MQESKYSLRYLPKYEEDLNEIVDYIIYRLYNARIYSQRPASMQGLWVNKPIKLL